MQKEVDMKKTNKDNVQKWSFLGGLILAVVASFIMSPWITLVLFVLGLIVGALNIDDKEVVPFLVAVIALGAIGASSLNALSPVLMGLTGYVKEIVTNVIAFVGAAGLVVAIKAIVAIGRD